MPKIILDVMGGDYGPQATLEGALQALPELSGELVLVGNEKLILRVLAKRHYQDLCHAMTAPHANCRVHVVHASESIDMDEKIKSIRSKPDASINVGCRLARDSWTDWKTKAKSPAAFISAGHSGAMMASALLNMGRLKGADRPAIAVKLPSLSEDGCVVLDVGANVDCKAEHLRDFAIMGALYAQANRRQSTLPRIAVLSNGEERTKGNELTRAAALMIEKLPCFSGKNAIGTFVGYAEGKEIFKGRVDVVVTDGFTGNLVLKSVEGLGSAVVKILKDEAKTNPLAMLGLLIASPVLKRLKRKLDYAETGAAPLLGIAGYAFVSHGHSSAKAIKNSILGAQSALGSRFVERMEDALAISAQEIA